MKSYVDLDQARKLAEILPLESADMCYIKGKAQLGFLYEEYKELGDSVLQEYEPCWSLAALLSVIPKPTLSQTMPGGWVCIAKGAETKRTICCSEPTDDDDNPIDTLVDMIFKLHKKNKLAL